MAAPHRLDQQNDPIRLDIWLFRTRLLKSRSLATKLILAGRIRVSRNGETSRRLKPHVTICPGDIITFMRGSELIHIEMLAPGMRRGPAAEARALYRTLPVDMPRGDSDG